MSLAVRFWDVKVESYRPLPLTLFTPLKPFLMTWLLVLVPKVVLGRPLSRVRLGEVLVGRAGSIHGFQTLVVSVVAAWAAVEVTAGPSIESEVECGQHLVYALTLGGRIVASYPWH